MSFNVLSWKIDALTHKKTNKTILSNIQGSVSSGQFLTIMGPSGAGKSSFLSLITKRITHRDSYFALDGQLMLNEQKYNLKQFNQFAAYVRQDDILPGTFTVIQSFLFQAKLKLSNKTKEQQDSIIDQTIKKLSLYNCKDTYIGQQNVKSISGGERKRVAIGLELISDPACLILDQPTSGLDSYNALKLIEILNQLTKQTQKIIIATLHQPSSLIFKQMKQLLLLNKGQIIYNGPAVKIVDYMTQIGIKVNHKMNPADFFMLQISQFTQLNRGCQTRMTALAFMNYKLELKQQKQNHQITQYEIKYNTSKASWFLQFVTLFQRSFKNAYRSKKNVSQHVGDLIWSITLNAIVYWMVAKDVPSILDVDAFRKYWIQVPSALYVVQFSIFGSNLYNTVLLFPSQKQLCYKESGSGLYSLSSFISARILVDFPVSTIKTIILGASIYYAMGLTDLSVLGIFIFTLTLVGYSSYMLGLLCGVAFSKANQATQIVPILVTPIAMVGGMVVKLTTVGAWISWLQYLSPIRHGFFAIMIYGLNSPQYDILKPYKDQLLQYKGIFGTWQQCIYYLLAMTIGFFVLSMILMKLKMRAL